MVELEKVVPAQSARHWDIHPAWGILPLLTFAGHLLVLLVKGNPDEIMWMCHISNVMLAVGLFLGLPSLLWPASLWLLFGIPLWLTEVVATGDSTWTSTIAHLVGFAMSVMVMCRVTMPRWSWLYATMWYVVIQHACRMVTRPCENVNLAYRVHDGWERIFTNYWYYWLVCLLTAAVTLWLIQQLCRRVIRG